jgi:prophage regulatory protein
MRMLSFPDLKSEKGIRFSRQHIDRLVKAKRFPRPVKLGEQTNGWPEDEIDRWLRDRIKERDEAMAPAA